MSNDAGYAASAVWGPRAETPNDLAARWIETLASVQAIDPVFARLYAQTRDGRATPRRPHQAQLDAFAEQIAKGVVKDRDGTVEPVYGYLAGVCTTSNPALGPKDFEAHLRAGCGLPFATNAAYLVTAFRQVPDPSIVTYTIFRSAIIALSEPFGALFANAYPHKLVTQWTQGRASKTLPASWISYLAPRFAPLVTPPTHAIVERRPDGGLLMAATDETFDVDNPAHMAVARDIEAALAPFNAMPWPRET